MSKIVHRRFSTPHEPTDVDSVPHHGTHVFAHTCKLAVISPHGGIACRCQWSDLTLLELHQTARGHEMRLNTDRFAETQQSDHRRSHIRVFGSAARSPCRTEGSEEWRRPGSLGVTVVSGLVCIEFYRAWCRSPLGLFVNYVLSLRTQPEDHMASLDKLAQMDGWEVDEAEGTHARTTVRNGIRWCTCRMLFRKWDSCRPLDHGTKHRIAG